MQNGWKRHRSRCRRNENKSSRHLLRSERDLMGQASLKQGHTLYDLRVHVATHSRHVGVTRPSRSPEDVGTGDVMRRGVFTDGSLSNCKTSTETLCHLHTLARFGLPLNRCLFLVLVQYFLTKQQKQLLLNQCDIQILLFIRNIQPVCSSKMGNFGMILLLTTEKLQRWVQKNEFLDV